MKIVIRNHHVARIADDVYQLLVPRIEVLVSLYEAWPGNAVKLAVRDVDNIRNQIIDIQETDLFFRKQQIRDQKPCPRIARSGIGNQETIIRENVEIAASSVQPHEGLESVDQVRCCSQHSTSLRGATARRRIGRTTHELAVYPRLLRISSILE